LTPNPEKVKLGQKEQEREIFFRGTKRALLELRGHPGAVLWAKGGEKPV